MKKQVEQQDKIRQKEHLNLILPVCSLGNKSPVSHLSTLSSGHRYRIMFPIFEQLYSAELFSKIRKGKT